MKTRSKVNEDKLTIHDNFAGLLSYSQTKNHTIKENESFVIDRGEVEYASRLHLEDGSKVLVKEGGQLNIGFLTKFDLNFVVTGEKMPQGNLLDMHNTSNIHVEKGGTIRFRDSIDIDDMPNIHNDGTILTGRNAHEFLDLE